ncbi:hypothetical protein J1N35_043504 [Gossypium stocksii]|uniref:Reverse transcriptase Ty1/copia-type domain-containing protein n=1 Tax=Gossypium stocksii TaxID=47602 RepID=A0A9D3U7E0_9ROSI|nr:hypothetical protein J1N35_043504 [Gossypium stocksii]
MALYKMRYLHHSQVDDIILTRDDVDEIRHLKEHLSLEFEIRDLGPLKYFLGMEVAQSKKGPVVS